MSYQMIRSDPKSMQQIPATAFGPIARVVCLCAVLAFGCAAKNPPPEPSTSEYLKTKGGGFEIDGKDGAGVAKMGVVLEWVKRPPDGTTYVAEFENPASPGGYLRVSEAIDPSSAQLIVRSPALSCVTNNRSYLVVISLFADKERKVQIGDHRQRVNLSVAKRHLDDLKIQECKFNL